MEAGIEHRCKTDRRPDFGGSVTGGGRSGRGTGIGRGGSIIGGGRSGSVGGCGGVPGGVGTWARSMSGITTRSGFRSRLTGVCSCLNLSDHIVERWGARDAYRKTEHRHLIPDYRRPTVAIGRWSAHRRPSRADGAPFRKALLAPEFIGSARVGAFPAFWLLLGIG